MRMLSNWIASYAEYTDISEAPLTFDFLDRASYHLGSPPQASLHRRGKVQALPEYVYYLRSPSRCGDKKHHNGGGNEDFEGGRWSDNGAKHYDLAGVDEGIERCGAERIPISSPDIIDPLAIEYNTQSAITCEVSELGTFLNMQDDGLIAMLIDLWDGRDVPWERWLSTKENVKIINPLIGIVGATTPSWLERHFDEIAIGNGLTSRIVFVYGEAKRRYIPYVSDLVEAEGQKQLSEALVHDLREIAKLKGKFTITREAKNIVGDWYEQHWTDPEEHLQDPRFAGYRARKFAHLHKVAMCLSASEGDSLTIDVPHIALAFHVLGGIEGDMLKVLNTIGKVQSSRQMDAILATLRVRGRMLRSDLWKGVMSTIPPREFSDAIDGLAQAGVIKLTTVAGEGTYIRLVGGDENGNNEE
jgi:hypothetical protein